MRYNVTGHPLLSEDAAALGAPELTAHVEVAEVLLGFNKFTAFDAANQTELYNQARHALVLQVNFQVESGVEAFVLDYHRRGDRGKSYRGGKRMLPVHTQAKKIATAIRPKPTTTTLR